MNISDETCRLARRGPKYDVDVLGPAVVRTTPRITLRVHSFILRWAAIAVVATLLLLNLVREITDGLGQLSHMYYRERWR